MTTNDEAIRVSLVRSKLSDGSDAFAVFIPQLMLDATTERDALHLIGKITDAINEHTNERAVPDVGCR